MDLFLIQNQIFVNSEQRNVVSSVRRISFQILGVKGAQANVGFIGGRVLNRIHVMAFNRENTAISQDN